MGKERKARRRFKDVFTRAVEAFDLADGFDAPCLASAFDKHDEIDGLRDEPARNGRDHFLDQLLNAIECRSRRIRMHRGDAARVTRIPGFQHVEGFTTPDLADDDAIGP